MKTCRSLFVVGVAAVVLAGCGGQPQQYAMQTPAGAPPETVTVPKGNDAI